MISKERDDELFELWLDEMNTSWRDDYEDYTLWRETLTDEEKRLVAEWDRETPEDRINQRYTRRR